MAARGGQNMKQIAARGGELIDDTGLKIIGGVTAPGEGFAVNDKGWAAIYEAPLNRGQFRTARIDNRGAAFSALDAAAIGGQAHRHLPWGAVPGNRALELAFLF